MAGETTAIVLRVTAGGVTGVSAGDSEAWVVSAAGIDILTSGQHRKRLGSGQCSPFEFRRAALDGVLVVATDGLFNHAMADAVAACCAAGSVDETVARLLALPRLAPGRYPDDVAVVAVVPSERPAAGR